MDNPTLISSGPGAAISSSASIAGLDGNQRATAHRTGHAAPSYSLIKIMRITGPDRRFATAQTPHRANCHGSEHTHRRIRPITAATTRSRRLVLDPTPNWNPSPRTI